MVFLTGEPAEELVEGLPGVSETIVETHEEVALAATIAMGGLAVLSVAALAAFRARALPRWVSGAGLVATIGVAGVMGYTANLGGQIRHTEIRSGGGAPGGTLDRAADDERAERAEH